MKTELTTEQIEARRRYQREWRAANRDKVTAYERRRWERVAAAYAAEDAERAAKQTATEKQA